MDEDVIVREIVKSLAFEIEATNEDNVLKWTSTNGTPLSVKVRVRNPDEPRLVQKGPFPIPRIGITAPDRLRLVSSDQTILSFNIYLDKEAQKQEEYKRSKLFQLFNIGGCLGTIGDDDGPYLPSSSNQKAITHKSSSRSDSAIIDTPHTVPPHNESRKWPFGRCKPGGCLDPPFGEEKYHYTPSKADRRTKLALEIRELEKKQAPERVDSTLTEKQHIKAGSKENYQQKIDTARHEVEPKKEIDVLCGASAESRRKSKEGSLQCRSSVQISVKDEVDSKKITDIYARKSRENSLVTYHIDTSSTESLYGPIPNPSIKSYNDSQRQTYEYPESYFVPPKDVLRYKEEERRYSKEPSNYQIGVSGLPKENDTTDKINAAKAVVVEHKTISQNARGSKDINMKKLKLTLTELQSNNVDVAQKLIEDKISSTHLASDSKEPLSYIHIDSKNIDDYRNMPDTRTEADFKTIAKNSMKEKEDFKFQKPKKLRSGNDDIANIEANSNIPIKESTIDKPDDIILSNDEISKPLKLQTSTLTDSNVDEFSEVVKINGRTLDKSHVSYPNNKSLNDQIGASGKENDNDITDKSNLIKAGMVDHKPVTQNSRRSKDINMQKIEPKSAELQPNNIDFAQKGRTGKASPTRLASDSKEPVSYILTDSNNVDDHKNVPYKILRSGNVDMANIEAKTDIPIKVRTTEKLDGIIPSSDGTYKPIKSQSSPLSDSKIDEISEVVKINGRTLDKTRVSYPNKESSNDQISASGKVKENDIIDNIDLIKVGIVDHNKPITQNARRSKDINLQKIYPKSAELQLNNIDFGQKTKYKVSPTRLASDSKEPVSYTLTDSKNVDDYKNVPDKILRSGNVDMANIEANTDIPIKVRTTEKLDGIILSSDGTYKPIKSQSSPLSDSNIDEISEVVKKNDRTLDKTRVSYPNKESLSEQISASGKEKDNNITDKSNLIKAGMVDYKPITPNARRSKDINLQKIEPKSAYLQPNNIDFAQKGRKGKASPTRLASDSKEPVSYILTDSKNDHKNVPNKILRSGNVDMANIEANTDIPRKVCTTEKLDDIVLSGDESYKPIKSQASPISDSNTDEFSEVVKTNGRTFDETHVSYPNNESSNNQTGASGKVKDKVFPEAVNTMINKKPNTYSSATTEMQNNMLPPSNTTDLYSDKTITKDQPYIKPSLPESRSNVVKVPDSSYQNVSSKADQTLPETDFYKNRKTDIYTTPSAGIETKKSSNQSEVVGSPDMKKQCSQDAQYKLNDFNIKLPRESKTIPDHEAFSTDKSFSGIPAQKLVVDPDQQTASKQNYESTKQLELNKVSNRQSISGYENVEETVNNNDGKTTLHETSKKQSQITKDKPNLKANERDDYAILNKLYPEVQRYETNVQTDKSKNLTPSRKSSYENKEFDVSSTHSIDFKPKHLSSNELNDEVDTLPKKQTSAILQKTPFIPRHDLDIHDNDINKSTQLKRQTFTIIGSDTSLPKKEEIEETPKDVTNIYSKATDNAKSLSPSQTHDKTDILDARSKKLNTKIQSNASVESPLKTTQENANKNDFKITDKHKSDSKDQAHNKAETLNRSDKAPGNTRDLILSGYQTDNLAPENNNYMPDNINDLRSTSDRRGLLGDQNRDESDTKKREGSKEYNIKFNDVASGSLLDKPIPDLYSKDTDYDRAPSTQVSGKAETLRKNNIDFEKIPNCDSTIDSTISQKHLQESTKPRKFTGNVESALSPENRVNAEMISSDRNTVRNNESDKFSLSSKNSDKTENVIETDSQESLPENIKYIHSKVASDDMSIPVFPIINETGFSVSHDRTERTRERDGSSENVVQENVRDLYAHVTDDGKLNQYMQNRDKSESLSITSKLMENKTHSSPTKDISKKSIPQNQNFLYSEDIDHDELVTVVPKRDGTEHLVKSYKEQEDVKYKDIDGEMFTKLGVNSSPKLVPRIIPNIDQVTDDAKYIVSDQFETGFTSTDSNQSQIKIPRENSKQSDVSDYYDNIKAPDEIEFTENVADRYSKLSNKPIGVSEKSPPDNGYLGLISKELSKISLKAEEEERFTKPSIGRDATLRRDREIIHTNSGVNQDNEPLGDQFSHTTIPKMPITHVSNIDFALKLDDDIYNLPKNTLENPSISTFEINRDLINTTVTEAFDNVKHVVDDSDHVKRQSNDYRIIINKPINTNRDVPFTNKSDISEKPTDYRSSKVPISVNDNIDRNRESFDTKPSVYIRGEEQNERTSPRLQVIKESGSQNDISYLDMSFYSYINDNNQRVVQTYSPPNKQQRGNDATVTLVKTLIRHGNEVRIPVDKENDLTLNIVDKHSRVCDAGSSIESPTRHPHREHHIVDHAKNQDVLTKNLALIYESGLIPLHNVIKDLTQQVNNLTAKQEILQGLKSSAKRTKSLRLIPVVKRCGCKRI